MARALETCETLPKAVNEVDTRKTPGATGTTLGTLWIDKAKRAFWAAARAARPLQLWPVPYYDAGGREPFFLFIITPPFSGSTALAQVLNTASRSMLLQGRGEAQWLVPGMYKKDSWNPEKRIHCSSVRAVWMSRFQLVEALVGRIDVVIEKSPENLVRMDKIAEVFPNHAMVAFNRNPYANTSSILYRVHGGERKAEAQRCAILRQLALDWAFRSTLVKRWIREFNAVHFTYEEFCSDPDAQLEKIIQVVPELADVDTSRSIKVKDYTPQGISNQNQRQIARLSAKERMTVGEILEDHEELLAYFGYTSKWQTPIDLGGAGDV